ncbi:MAG: flagellar protein FliT [Thermoleophilia bacterium]|nr:flagellar protein FliT [Thermoleophilia bacterium]
MLADLERIRDLQVLQRRALIDADGERLADIDAERGALNARLMPLDAAGLAPFERERAEELVCQITAEHESLMRVAEEIRRNVGLELGTLSQGRGALRAYRVPGASSSSYVDKER